MLCIPDCCPDETKPFSVLCAIVVVKGIASRCSDLAWEAITEQTLVFLIFCEKTVFFLTFVFFGLVSISDINRRFRKSRFKHIRAKFGLKIQNLD